MEPASNPATTKPWSSAQETSMGSGLRSEIWVADESAHPWDGYLSGPENALAIAAAQAIACGKPDGVSPLVVYGPSGVGKSRLLAGMSVEWLRRHPGMSVVHLGAESFVSACLEAAAVAGGVGWSALRGRFRSVNLFVLEDIEGLERGPLARDELVHTLDALDATGAAVAFSAKSTPATWPHRTWPRRLINRLMGGLATPIAAPGLISRRRYILQHASQHDVALQSEAVETLAEAADSYRTLEGWISRLALEARLNHPPAAGGIGQATVNTGRRSHPRARPIPLDSRQVAAILADEAQLVEPQVTIDTIARGVAKRFGIRLSLLRSPSRRALIVSARHLAMYLARTFTGSSFATIGIYFGGRDSASVRYACRTTTLRLKRDPALAAVAASFEPRRSQSSTHEPRVFG